MGENFRFFYAFQVFFIEHIVTLKFLAKNIELLKTKKSGLWYLLFIILSTLLQVFTSQRLATHLKGLPHKQMQGQLSETGLLYSLAFEFSPFPLPLAHT